MNKKILLVSVFAVGMLASCGGSKVPAVSTNKPATETPTVAPTEAPASEYTPDYSKKVDLSIALNYDGTANRITYQQDDNYTTPAGTVIKKGDYKPVWSTIQTKMNMTLKEVEAAVTTKAVTYFKDNWQTTQYADIAAANVSDVNTFSVAGNSETILDISQYLDKMPNFSKFLDENPSVRLSITTAKHGDASKGAIYYFPYFDGYDDLEKMTMIRADYVRKLLDSNVALDEDASILTEADYEATEAEADGKAKAYSVTVPKADGSGTQVIEKKSTKNIIARQNELIKAGTATSKALVAQFKEYVNDRYNGAFAKVSDLFLGMDACYDADEMIALMRIAKASPAALTGDATKKIIGFVPREYNNSRIADLYRWAGHLWGVRGLESRSGYLYINAQGKLCDTRGSDEVITMLGNLNKLYKEGLILQNFEAKTAAGVSDGKFAQGTIVGLGTTNTEGTNYAGLMEYDYSQTQGVWNDKAASQAVEGYDFRPIVNGVANWDDGDDSTGYYQFTESWRSVKTQGLVLNASLAQDEDKLDRALALCDFFWSDEGHQLNSYGPESEGYTSGTIDYQGKQVAKFTDKALEQLNDTNIGKGSYTGYLRTYVGATLPVGYIKEQGMEYQCTSENAKNGLTIINKAIELGTFKHVQVGETTNPFDKIVPSSFFLTSGQATMISQLNDKSTLGSITSDSSNNSWCEWDKYVMYGFGDTDHSTQTTEGYSTLVNTTWKLNELVKIYQDAYDFMNE